MMTARGPSCAGGALVVLAGAQSPLTRAIPALRERGFRVVACESVEDACAAPAADAVLVDLRGRSPEVVSRVKEGLQDVEVIAIQEDATLAVVVEAARRGAFEFVEQPFSLEQLVAAIVRAVSRGSLVRENRALREILGGSARPLPVEQHGARMRALMADVERLAPLDDPVLIEGESGTGKAVVARAIHDRSSRRSGPWLPVACGGSAGELVERELFGHESGAFPEARSRRLGLVEVAAFGTILLDEAAGLPLDVQGRLLRLVETGELRRVGGTATLSASARMIVATREQIESLVSAGRFREDLFYRLALHRLRVPPLRERLEEVPAFVAHFLRSRGLETVSLPPDVLRALSAFDWPGNVRELKSVVDRLILKGPLDRLTPGHLSSLLASRPAGAEDLSLERHERDLVVKALVLNAWNRSAAARALGVSVRTLYEKIKRYGLAPPGSDPGP